MTRARGGRVRLALGHALIAIALQVVLAVALGPRAEPGTRAQAIGACLGTLALLVSSIALGARARARLGKNISREAPGGQGDPPARPGGPGLAARARMMIARDLAVPVPWIAVILMAAFVFLASGLALIWAHLSGLPRNGLVYAVLAVDVALVPALALSAFGAFLGVRGEGRWYVAVPGAIAGLVALQVAGGLLALQASRDPDIVNAVAIGSTILSFLVTGFVLALALRRVAFVESALVALGFGYVLYLAAAVLGEDLLAASDIPKEQILVVLAVVPSVIALCLLAVGASLGFMLTGAGKMDPSFSFESGMALRYLKLYRSARERAFRLGVEHAVLIFALQLAAIVLVPSPPPPFPAQALGLWAGSLAVFAGTFLLGVRLRPGYESRGRKIGVPWVALIVIALLLDGAALLFAELSPIELTDKSFGRAMLAGDFVVGPTIILGGIASVLGLHRKRRWYLALLGGVSLAVVLMAIAAVVALALRGPMLAKAAAGAGGLCGAWLLTGVALGFFRRKVVGADIVLVAIGIAYVVDATGAAALPQLLLSIRASPAYLLMGLALAPAPIVIVLLFFGAFIGASLRKRQRAMAESEQRARHPVGIILVVSVAGVCIGVQALVVVLSVMSGFENDLKTKILGAHAHVVVNKKGDDFAEYGEVETQVRQVPGVESAVAIVLGEGMISSEAGLSGTLVKGIDVNDEQATSYLRANISQGRIEYLIEPEQIPGARLKLDPTETSTEAGAGDFGEPAVREPSGTGGGKTLPGIIVGRELAKTLRVYLGDTVNLVSPVSEEIGPTGPQPKLRRYRIAGIFFSGMYEYDSKFAYLSMEQAQRFFGMRGKATAVEIRVTDVDDTPRLVDEIKRRVGGYPYTVKDWREMNKELFSALLLEKLAMFIVLTIIIAVASFNIVSTLAMIVLEKGREIAILKSMGASESSVMKIFVVQGVIIGVAGAVLGLFSGVGFCRFLDIVGFPLDSDVFYIDRLPVVMDTAEIAIIGIAAVVITYLATIYPAMAAAQLRPVEGLRDE